MHIVYCHTGRGMTSNKPWRYILTQMHAYTYWLRHRPSPNACVWLVPGTMED